MGDPVGNFHYVEKRLKQGITVSRGGGQDVEWSYI